MPKLKGEQRRSLLRPRSLAKRASSRRAALPITASFREERTPRSQGGCPLHGVCRMSSPHCPAPSSQARSPQLPEPPLSCVSGLTPEPGTEPAALVGPSQGCSAWEEEGEQASQRWSVLGSTQILAPVWGAVGAPSQEVSAA